MAVSPQNRVLAGAWGAQSWAQWEHGQGGRSLPVSRRTREPVFPVSCPKLPKSICLSHPTMLTQGQQLSSPPLAVSLCPREACQAHLTSEVPSSELLTRPLPRSSASSHTLPVCCLVTQLFTPLGALSPDPSPS